MTHGDETRPQAAARGGALPGGHFAHRSPTRRRDGARPAAYDQLHQAGIRSSWTTATNLSPGWKFNEWELKGCRCGWKSARATLKTAWSATCAANTFERAPLPLDNLAQGVCDLLADIQRSMFALAKAFMDEHTKDVHSYDELKEQVQTGYARAMWCGQRSCEDKIKEETSATSRNMPFDQTLIGDTCVCCGEAADKVMYFSKAY